MMINKRLINTVAESKKYIAGNVLVQWCSLVANIIMMTSITAMLAKLLSADAGRAEVISTLVIAVLAVSVRFICSIASARMGYLSSKTVKSVLRQKIYTKLLKLGASYKERVNTSEVVQVCVEGVDQLETYFAAYLPQFFYAMLAPITLFIYLSFVNFACAIVLLICVPMIPVSIAAVQTWAKKLLAKYWGKYTALGDTFLENLQGLITLKIYQADEFKNEEMDRQAEEFRVVTMKVLTMQLNSITIMDLIAYGGAAMGVILSATQFATGNVSLAGCLLIIMLSADFFIPMRQLGSFFHVAMNGMAASDKIFRILDLPEEKDGIVSASEKHMHDKQMCPGDYTIRCDKVHFSYEKDREILHGINMEFPMNSFTAIVGESGCGKSTISSILMGRNKGYTGSIMVGKHNEKNTCGGQTCVELRDIKEESLMKNFTYISHQSYLFKGTVRYNLLMGKPDATDEELWIVLEKVKLAEFVRNEKGLDTPVAEKGGNLSGGQCQRLALARALLHNSPVYIFDEATSNIDVESENAIMKQINELAKVKTVILISHRLVNVAGADNIYVLDSGEVVESGNHNELLSKKGVYFGLWNAQQMLESYVGGEA